MITESVKDYAAMSSAAASIIFADIMKKLSLLMILPMAVSAQLLVRPYSQTNEDLEKRVRGDFPALTDDAAFAHYAVPSMSDRQRLADVYPDDGIAGGKVTILAAKGEYEPGAFLIYPFRDLGKVELKLSPLVTDDGKVFPAENLDLSIVKVWYQNGNGWYSYFGDCGKKLCPELLLHDEDLIRVDTESQSNYARLTKPDGTTFEKWINPPRQMDKLDVNSYHAPNVFQPMRPGFADAKILQPVTLNKGEFKSFILTARTTAATPAGLYRGTLTLSPASGGLRQPSLPTHPLTNSPVIPVEIKVLDFDLPQYPGTYADPSREFMTANYGYISVPLIMKENGGDEALAQKQFVAVCRDLISHNQSLLKNRSTGGADFESTIKMMKDAGMRTDVYMGGVGPLRNGNPDEHREDLARHAQRLAAKLDRMVGHHNMILAYGDEPGQQWIVDNRIVFEEYQKQGFKFLIAGSDNIFLRAGHFFDWHNIAKDPVDDSTTRLWSQMADDKMVAWYAAMHVGPENPAFNRRQYGMAPYLSGYTAVCNYAHHFGPYNDDTTTYRPMVFAYGTADGVIDTLAWEGFREGIDDIRYATVLSTYARAAVATKKREGRVLGNSALRMLATFDRAAGDLNYCRAEMIDHILKLKDFLGNEVPEVVTRPPSFDPDPTVEKYVAPENPSAEQLMSEMRYAEASEKFEAEGRIVEAARAIYDERVYKGGAYVDDEPRLDRLYRKILAGGLGEPNDRRQAGVWLLTRGAAGAETYLPQAIGEGPRATNDFYRAITGVLWRDYAGESRPLSAPFYGAWPTVIEIEKLARAVATSAKVQAYTFQEAYTFAIAHAATGDLKSVPEILKLGLAQPKLKPAEKAALELIGELLSAESELGGSRVVATAVPESSAAAGTVPGPPVAAEDGRARRSATVVITRVKEISAKLFTDLAPEDQLKAYDWAGAFFNFANDEVMLRAMVEARPVLPSLVDKKRYTVHYSEKPIGSGRDMDDAAIEAQPFERQFGTQSMSFMQTDVSTGDRGEAAAAADGAKPSELRVVADEWGLHIRLDAFDPRAKEFAAGLQDFGSFESYLAPGENQPYTCFIQRLKNPASPSVFNTTYSTPGHRRIDLKDSNTCRTEVYFTDKGAAAYLGLAWDNFATLVPAKNSVWDFESVNWGPNKSTWNGTESIHGRSTWGQFVFDFPESARLAILRRQIHLAVRAFREESKAMPGKLGAAIFWSDPELGDPIFYYRDVKPLVDKLETAAKRATSDMDDDTVKDLAENYLTQWRDIRFTIQRLRTEFLKLRANGQLCAEPETIILPWGEKMICIAAPATKDIDRFCDFITKRLGPDGFSTLVLHIQYRYQFESHPDCRESDPLSKDDIAKIMKACDTVNVKLIPYINLFGQQECLEDGSVTAGILKVHPEFDESSRRRDKISAKLGSGHVICPQEPEAQKIALELALELVAVCDTDAIHIGCDDVFDIGFCEKCSKVANKWQSKGNGQLFADWVNGLARGLKDKGIRAMIWADRLVPCDLTRLGPLESSNNGTHRALPLLDKDIILCDLHSTVAEGYPSVDILQDAGFDVLPGVGKDIRSAKLFLDYAKKHDRGKIDGVIFAVHTDTALFLDALEGKHRISDDIVSGEVEVYKLLPHRDRDN